MFEIRPPAPDEIDTVTTFLASRACTGRRLLPGKMIARRTRPVDVDDVHLTLEKRLDR